MVVRNPIELEIHARYARQRAEAEAAHRALVARSAHRAPLAPAITQLRRRVGRGLIAAGQRLVGPVPATPTAPSPAR